MTKAQWPTNVQIPMPKVAVILWSLSLGILLAIGPWEFFGH
jgi:hypothetical protein